ncbi:MAG: hypothetical protein SFV15_03975 [Polyangiaceae bacterium]|nr:hypothetical protein [Polyangiaceae bacterium]
MGKFDNRSTKLARRRKAQKKKKNRAKRKVAAAQKARPVRTKAKKTTK